MASPVASHTCAASSNASNNPEEQMKEVTSHCAATEGYGVQVSDTTKYNSITSVEKQNLILTFFIINSLYKQQ